MLETNFRYIAVHDIINCLGVSKSKALHAFLASTGSDQDMILMRFDKTRQAISLNKLRKRLFIQEPFWSSLPQAAFSC